MKVLASLLAIYIWKEDIEVLSGEAGHRASEQPYDVIKTRDTRRDDKHYFSNKKFFLEPWDQGFSGKGILWEDLRKQVDSVTVSLYSISLLSFTMSAEMPIGYHADLNTNHFSRLTTTLPKKKKPRLKSCECSVRILGIICKIWTYDALEL